MSKPTPIHSINLDFSHSSEAKTLARLVAYGLNKFWDVDSIDNTHLFEVYRDLIDAVELLESLEG